MNISNLQQNNIISYGFSKSVEFMGSLTLAQLDVLNISPATVHFLKEALDNGKVTYKQDPHPNATLQIYRHNKEDILIRSATDFDQVSKPALAWAIFSEIKDFDQMIKGEQPFRKTSPEDMDDKLLHQLSENQLPMAHNIITGLMQMILRERTAAMRMVTRTCSELTVMPIIAAMAHRVIAHRCDKFAARILGMTYHEYTEDIQKVIQYDPVEQSWHNFCVNAQPPDKIRILKTEKIAAGSETFRDQHGIPAFKL